MPQDFNELNVNTLGPSRIVDTIIQGTFAATLSKILSGEVDWFNFNNILLLLIVLVIPELKTILIEIIKYFKELIQKKLVVLWEFLNNKISSFFNKNDNSINQEKNYNYEEIEIKLNNYNVIDSIIEYVENQKETNYNPAILKIYPNGISSFDREYAINNLYFFIDDLEVKLKNNLVITRDEQNCIINVCEKTNSETNKILKHSIKINCNDFYLVYLPKLIENVSDFKESIYETFENNHRMIANKPANLNQIASEIFLNYKYYNGLDLEYNLIVEKNSKFNNDSLFNSKKSKHDDKKSQIMSCLKFYLLLNLEAGSTTGISFSEHHIVFDELSLKIHIDNGRIHKTFWDMSTCIFSYKDFENIDKYRPFVRQAYNKFYRNKSKYEKVKNLQFTILDSNKNYPNLTEAFFQKYQKKIIDSYTFKHQALNKKSKVWNVRMITETEKETIENPDYDSDSDDIDINDIDKNDINKINEDNFKDFKNKLNKKNNKKKKEKFININKPIRKISCKQVSSQYKPFSTLYLREEDKFKLKNMLDNFNKAEEIYDKLGIRRKLGIMLHGEPGTGKSTSIVAIASYLKRDIYYVNLKGVKKNHELQDIFNYVQQNGLNKGIIVIEEIEKQTPIVYNNSVSDDIKGISESFEDQDNELDLSYLLNLLDGTISQDNCVFIISTNHLDLLEPALFRSGRIDVNMEFKLCDKYQIRTIYKNILNRDLSHEIINKIPEDKFSPADIIFEILPYLYETDISDEMILKKFIL
ncbi:MAG: hypothetical protein CMF62_03720 [Magnetococcales bacterium]|nr:hypothetical protein [Magnetococcales bacterium]|tara:strand:- start:2562 stop:4826 length:2265 start_codon:yes stop_codon:yes gene_type:complete